MSKKQQVILELFRRCRERGDERFHNEEVRAVCQQVGFGNPFDATKIDQRAGLPPELQEADYGIIHLGRGWHRFIRGIRHIYHDFEPIPDYEDWHYRPSLLNEYNTSEANILSVANNQRILHHFLFGLDREFATVDIDKRPKTYFPHRTKMRLAYRYGAIDVSLDNIQIEIDLTIEYQGTIGVFEAKNGDHTSFAVYQLFHPFLYYHHARHDSQLAERIGEIVGVYLIRRTQQDHTLLDLRAYTFTDPLDITSIMLKKAHGYRLVK